MSMSCFAPKGVACKEANKDTELGTILRVTWTSESLRIENMLMN